MTKALPVADNQATNAPVLIVYSEYNQILERLKDKTHLTMMIAHHRDEFFRLLEQYVPAIAVIDTYDEAGVASDVLQKGVPIIAIQSSKKDALSSNGSSSIEYVYCMNIVRQFSVAIEALLKKIQPR